MKFRNTLILIAVLAILAGYVYFFEIHKEEKPTEEELAKVVFDLNPDEIAVLTVRVTEEGKERIARVRREPGQPWQIEEPVQEPAFDTKVTNIVKRFAELEAVRRLEEAPSDVAVYGLNPHQIELTAQLQDGSEHTLLVGDMNPTRSGYFAQRRGNPAVYLVSTSLIQDLKKWVNEPPLVPTPTPTSSPTPEGTPTPTSMPAVETPKPTT